MSKDQWKEAIHSSRVLEVEENNKAMMRREVDCKDFFSWLRESINNNQKFGEFRAFVDIKRCPQFAEMRKGLNEEGVRVEASSRPFWYQDDPIDRFRWNPSSKLLKFGRSR